MATNPASVTLPRVAEPPPVAPVSETRRLTPPRIDVRHQKPTGHIDGASCVCVCGHCEGSPPRRGIFLEHVPHIRARSRGHILRKMQG